MHRLDLLARRRFAFDKSRKAREQPDEAFRIFGVNVTHRRMQLRQQRMADQLDV